MQRLGLIAAVFVAFSTLSLSGQGQNGCNFAVQKVRYEGAGGLTSEQREKLRDLVIGQCYDPARPGSVGEYIQEQLRQWGYRKIEVYDLEKFQVLDDSVHPSLITLFIDLRVSDLRAWRNCPTVEPRDAGYEDAMALREVLARNGVEVWCVARSKMAHVFEGQLDAALFATAEGRFEALFFPHEERLQNLVITSEYQEGEYTYTFSGTPRWRPGNQTVAMKRPSYFVRSGNRLFITSRMELASRLESIFVTAGSEPRFENNP